MKRFIACIAALVFSTTLVVAQEKTATEKSTPESSPTDFRFVSKVFEIHNRDPRAVVTSLLLLGSGYKNAGINVNDALRTITVRDFPENVAAIEDAIKRLDRPFSDPDIDLKLAVLIASNSPGVGKPVPEDLASVVRQLQSTLRYSNYSLLAINTHRTKAGHGLKGSGSVDTPESGQELPASDYEYSIRNLAVATTGEKPALNIENFEFYLKYRSAKGSDVVRFESPVSLRQEQKVVLGTAAMGDKALIVVLSADFQ